MKKLLFIICFLPMFSYGGTIYKILSDTVFIGSIPYRTATGELLLFNATKDTTESVLYNTGNGKTEFKKVRLIRLNDSTYVFKIGTTVIGDSIKIRSSGSGGGGGGSGTLTDFIFTDGNGFDGTVTSSTTTPTLSLVADTLTKFASVKRVLDSLIDVNARIKNGDSIYFFRTFAQLKSAMTAHTLKKGASYQMTDFQTIYPQPDFNDDGSSKDSVAVKTSAVEQLVFKANSDSTFDNYVSSIEYPTDIIHFDWSYTTTEVMDSAAKGRIVYREDTLGNKTDYDWRTVLFKRYRQDGIYSVFYDNDSISAEFPTFNFSYAVNNNSILGYTTGYELSGQVFYLSNNVFRKNAIFNKMDVVYWNTFLDNAHEIVAGDGIVANTFFGGIYYTYFGHGATFNFFLGVSENNYFGDQMTGCTFGARCQDNSIWDKMTDCTFGTDFIRNIQYGELKNSAVGDTFQDAIIYGIVDSIVVGNGCSKIDLKSVKTITIGNYNSKITIGGSIPYSTLSGSVRANITIGDNNNNINFGGAKNITTLNNISGISNVDFSGAIDGSGWSNGITIPLHPQMYTTFAKQIIKASNGSVYTRYFNGLTDVITIID